MSQTLSKCDFQKPSVTDAMACHVKHPKSRGPPSWGSTDLSNLCLRYLSNVWIMNQIFLKAHHRPDFEACLCRGSCWAARSRRSFSWVASSSPRVSMSQCLSSWNEKCHNLTGETILPGRILYVLWWNWFNCSRDFLKRTIMPILDWQLTF